MADLRNEGDGDGRPGGRLPRWVDGAVSVLHAAFGDFIDARGVAGLATPMALFEGQRPLPTTPEALRRARPAATGRVCLFVHGLGCHEGVWTFPMKTAGLSGETYGTLLARDLGFTSYAVRYNTGLPIARNGSALSGLLDALFAAHPVPLETLVLVGHSMGGLVARSACRAGAAQAASWIPPLRQVITLGTPHVGAPLEHLVHHAGSLLGQLGTTATDVLHDVIGTRSRGIRDLRLGGMGQDATEDGTDELPWLPGVALHRVAGVLFERGDHPLGSLVGDGMVPPRSATGGGAPGDTAVVPGVSHLGLCHDRRVYERIRAWCAPLPRARDGFLNTLSASQRTE